MDNFRHWISLCESAPDVIESAPPGKKAERFIKKHKKEFHTRYGKRGDQVLYATAWKHFREGVTLREYLSQVEAPKRRARSRLDPAGFYSYDHSSSEILSGPHKYHVDAMNNLRDYVNRPEIPVNFGVIYYNGKGHWS